MAETSTANGVPEDASQVRQDERTSSTRRSNKLLLRTYLLVWYFVSIGVLSLFPTWKFGAPVWRLPQSHLLPCAALGAAFMVSAGVAILLGPESGLRSLLLVTLSTIAIYGLAFLGIIVARYDFSREVILAVFVSSIVLIIAPHLLTASWSVRGLALGALLATLAVDQSRPDLAPRLAAHLTPKSSSILLKSSYYNLLVDTHQGPGSAVHGGALARIGDRYLLLTGEGRLYLFGLNTDGPDFKLLPYQVPINGGAFATAAGRPWATSRTEAVEIDHNTGGEVLTPESFRTYGLLVQEVGAEVRIFVSHAYWHAKQACFVERVSMLRADRAAIFRGAPGFEWETLYETSPCLPVRGEHRRHGIPFVGYFGGGRMQLMDPQTILLSVGEFGFDGVASVEALSQDRSASYGKTVTINIADRRAALFTMGHRNPQGLYIDHAGTIWSTEHGPQGGDKLNRLIRGANYGWPYATYGTDYGSFTWPLNKPEPEWREYQDPVFAWVPSIAVSNLLVVEQGLFSRWRGDLLIASLKARTLFRAHVKDGHVLYFEDIFIGGRIRDLIEGHDGRILLWTDDSTLISISPDAGTSGEALFAEKCSGCHQSTEISGNRIGPNLSGVVGRRIASLQGYPDYSPALRGWQGLWTENRLDAFLKEPAVACPGTHMDMAGVANDNERSEIIGYLRTLQ